MGGAHAEDVGVDRNVGGKGEVVVGYSQWRGQALNRAIAKQAFASTATRERKGGVWGGEERQNTTGRKRERDRETRCKFNLPCMACSRRSVGSLFLLFFVWFLTLNRSVMALSVGHARVSLVVPAL